MTYQELRETKKNKLMADYNGAVSQGDMEKAWNLLSKLMFYKVVDKDWALNEINNTFSRKERQAVTRYDVRDKQYSDQLPGNIMIGSLDNFGFRAISLPHWIIRRELQFVGDQLAPEKVVKYTATPAQSHSIAHKYINEIDKLLQSETGKSLHSSWSPAIKSGRVIVYGLHISNGIQYVIPTIGYLMIAPKSKTSVTVTVLLDGKNMITQCINVADTYNDIMAALKSQLYEHGITDIEVKTYSDYKFIGRKQRENYRPPISAEQMVKKRKEEYEYSKLEEEAQTA